MYKIDKLRSNAQQTHGFLFIEYSGHIVALLQEVHALAPTEDQPVKLLISRYRASICGKALTRSNSQNFTSII